MSKITVWFIRLAMLYFLAAMLLGLHMSRTGPAQPFLSIHAHFNLLGWMSMMIYGVAYHILPRFSGRPLWSDRLSYWHLWLSNLGLIGMALGWSMRSFDGRSTALLVFSVIEAVSIFFFVLNMLLTIKPAPPPPKPAVGK